jgi:hypothetical protein
MKFSIRDLLWLTAVAAVVTAWWLDHRAQAKRIRDLTPIQTFIHTHT